MVATVVKMMCKYCSNIFEYVSILITPTLSSLFSLFPLVNFVYWYFYFKAFWTRNKHFYKSKYVSRPSGSEFEPVAKVIQYFGVTLALTNVSGKRPEWSFVW
jgi:hypothetical protein